MLVDNQIADEDDQNHQGCSHTDLEDDDDLDSPYEASERISKNQVDWHLLNDDQFFGELDIFIDTFVQQDLQDDAGYCAPKKE